jgi:hypothetical protein
MQIYDDSERDAFPRLKPPSGLSFAEDATRSGLTFWSI